MILAYLNLKQPVLTSLMKLRGAVADGAEKFFLILTFLTVNDLLPKITTSKTSLLLKI